MGFFKNWAETRIISAKVERMKVKAELAKAKAALTVAKTQKSDAQTRQFLKNYEMVNKVADKILEDYDSDGDNINKIIVPLIVKFLNPSGEGVAVSEREQKLKKVFDNLPPETQAQITKMLTER